MPTPLQDRPIQRPPCASPNWQAGQAVLQVLDGSQWNGLGEMGAGDEDRVKTLHMVRDIGVQWAVYVSAVYDQ
jgi:hypothetical protein